jgi:hypothetical protein
MGSIHEKDGTFACLSFFINAVQALLGERSPWATGSAFAGIIPTF